MKVDCGIDHGRTKAERTIVEELRLKGCQEAELPARPKNDDHA